tara:strand:- start:98 stop:418 length:321 start_codon:yes stop_codon:yes gene_type:complete
MIADTPPPPYYAVIFTSTISSDNQDYAAMAYAMVQLAQQQDGFLGIESARNELGITVSYWRDLESIKNWRENAQHSMAREKGRRDWYQSFKTRIAKVERDYDFERE